MMQISGRLIDHWYHIIIENKDMMRVHQESCCYRILPLEECDILLHDNTQEQDRLGKKAKNNISMTLLHLMSKSSSCFIFRRN